MKFLNYIKLNYIKFNLILYNLKGIKLDIQEDLYIII